MDRRAFVKFLALLAAGAAARPEQIAAFERYYEVNAPHADDLICVDEIFMSGMASRSEPTLMTFFPQAEAGPLYLGINAFGGIVRWVAGPDQKIVIRRRDFTWSIETWSIEPLGGIARYKPPFHEFATGHISYIGQDGKRVNQPLDWSETTAMS